MIHAAAISNTGPIRQANDDHYCLGPFVEQGVLTGLTVDVESAQFRRYGLLAAVADGMGGYAGGAVASRVVLETLSALFYSEKREGATAERLAEDLQRYLAQTTRVLEGVLRRDPALAEAGTTLAGMAMLPPDVLVIFHAGDSRVLRAAAGFVRCLTVDDTVGGADLASGRLTSAEAAEMSESGLLTRSLGLKGDATVTIDTEQSWGPAMRFLLGTDGWHGEGRGLSRATIQQHIRDGGAPEALAPLLLREAIAADGRDNATVVVIET